MISNVYPANELKDYIGKLSFTVDGWDKEPRISLRKATSSQFAWNHFIANSCRCTRGGTKKDAFRMGLAAAHIAITVNPALTRKTASLKNISLYS